MLMFQTNPVGVELFPYVNTFFCSHKFAWMLVTRVKTLYPFLFENGYFFCPVWPTIHTYPVKNGHRKRIFSKTLSRLEIFENAGFSFTCGRTKMEVFE